MSITSRFKTLIDTLFKRHLLLTNTALGTVFMGAGDVIQQSIEKRLYPGKVYEKERSKNLMLVGIGFGFLGHNWYKFLDSKFPGNSRKIILKKLLAEGAIGPPFLLGFFMSIGLLEKKTVEASFKDFKENLLLICMADWAVYLPLQAVNFYFLPPRYRVLYVMSLTLVYDVFLSYVIHKEENKRLYQGQESLVKD